MNDLPAILAKSRASADDVETAIRLVAEQLGMPDTASLAATTYRRLQVENQTLRLALRFYARGDNWIWNDGYCPTAADCGEKARSTLAMLVR